MTTINQNTKTMLQAILDNTHHRFIARDKDSSLYAFEEMPFYIPEDEAYDSLGDCMFLCEETCTMLILDHDIPLDINVDYFADIPVTVDTPMSIQELLNT